MSTNSTITLSVSDGYDSIYCHWDGNPKHVGKMLFDHYNTEKKVKELIALGSISSLCKHIKPEEGVRHTFYDPADDVTIAYHRDRGEGSSPSIAMCHTLDQVYDTGEEYNYMFENDEWHLVTKKDGEIKLTRLSDLMLAVN
jgi:hypothetical protein